MRLLPPDAPPETDGTPQGSVQQDGELPVARLACTGGHGIEPNEQNTQQSPAFGRSSVPHPTHSWKNRHASTGIVMRSV